MEVGQVEAGPEAFQEGDGIVEERLPGDPVDDVDVEDAVDVVLVGDLEAGFVRSAELERYRPGPEDQVVLVVEGDVGVAFHHPHLDGPLIVAHRGEGGHAPGGQLVVAGNDGGEDRLALRVEADGAEGVFGGGEEVGRVLAGQD